MDSLLAQLKYELKRFDAKQASIESVFIGGGTPSTVEAELYRPIFTLIRPYLQKDIEITSEANPNSATKEWLLGMYKLGVNRISFGVQSFDKEKLRTLNRAHNPQQAIQTVKDAHEIGFKNLSIDLIYAVLGDTEELLKHDLNTAFSLPINHLSAYALTIEEGTVFEKKPQMSKEVLKQTKELFTKIKEHGFTQYEISNFGTYQSKHNLGYWLYKDYIGVGSGAVGKLGNKRFYPTQNIEEYIKNPCNITEEILADEDIKLEKIFLGLRSSIGFEKTLLNKEEQYRAELLLNEEKLFVKGDRYCNPEPLLADEIALFITN